MLALLHSQDPTAFIKQHQLGVPRLLHTAATALSLQCPEILQILDDSLAELVSGSTTADAAENFYQQAAPLPLPAFETACKHIFAAGSADKSGDLMHSETEFSDSALLEKAELALKESTQALRKAE